MYGVNSHYLVGTETGEVEVGAFHIAQLIIVIVTETVFAATAIVKVLQRILVQQISNNPL